MKFSNNTVHRIIKNIDYIPVQLRTDKECQASEYYYIRKGDHSLLEFAFDSSNGTIHRITLLICKDYQVINEPYRIPENHKSGDVFAETSGEILSQVFRCEIYPNAVRVIVSDSVSVDYILSENLVWELNSRGDLISFCVLDPTGKVSDHCQRELEINHTALIKNQDAIN